MTADREDAVLAPSGSVTASVAHFGCQEAPEPGETVSAASVRGRSNRARGAAAERRVAAYLRTWWPDANRAVRTTHPDPGDIDGTGPDKWWSVKDCQDERIDAWMAEIAVKAPDRYGLLVIRRRGTADVGRWWCWLTHEHLADLTTVVYRAHIDSTALVRTELRHVVELLRQDEGDDLGPA